MSAYFLLRLRLVGRLLLELGWWRLLLLGAMLLATGSKALLTAVQHPVGQWAVPVLGAWMCFSAHQRRADIQFLHMVAPDFRWWLGVEYTLLLSPAVGMLLLYGGVGAAVVTIGLMVAVPWLPVSASRGSTQRRHSLFRAEAFEWVSGWRQGWGALAWLVLLGVSCWQQQHAMVAAGAAVLWLFWTLSCYGSAEPPTMLLTAARGVGSFLWRRLLLLWMYYFLTVAPLLVVMAVGPATWVGAAGVLLWSLAVLGSALLAKYAFYPSAFLGRSTQAGIVVLGLLFAVNTVYGAMFVAALPVLLAKSRRSLGAFRYD